MGCEKRIKTGGGEVGMGTASLFTATITKLINL
jgi:hypothetical protein